MSGAGVRRCCSPPPRRAASRFSGRSHVEPGGVVAPEIDESPLPRELPRAYALRIAEAKARAVAPDGTDAFVLAADTVVACGRRILPEVPRPRPRPRRCLELLSGRRHRVLGGVCVMAPGGRSASRAW